MFTRRQIVAAGSLLAFPAVIRAQGWFPAYPFALGVASGDPAPDGFVIWTRLAPQPYESHGGMPLSALPVTWEVAEDDRFATVVAKGEALARPELGHSVHVEVSGLRPDRHYWYRFSAGSERSLAGRARTLPAAGADIAALRFGVCGCQHYESGLYTAYRHMAEQDLAFVFHYGDFIYEYSPDYSYGASRLPVPKIRAHRLREIYSLDDYRAHYAQHLLDLDLQSARSRHAFLSSFDDHEIHNNWVGPLSQDEGVPPEVFAFRKQAALQAWYEHMPVRRALLPRGPLIHTNRQIAYGNLAAVNVMDTRGFRTDQPCGDGFKPSCPGTADPAAQVFGAAQEAWLDGILGRRDTAWNCIAQQVMMMPLDRRTADQPEPVYNMDSWAAYDTPRARMMARLGQVGNAVVLTGDEHQHYAGLLHDGDRPVAAEFVTTSIASGGDGEDLRPGSDRILAGNPQLKFINNQRGFSICEVTRQAWQTHFMVLDKVSAPGGSLSKRATATVPRGAVELAIS